MCKRPLSGIEAPIFAWGEALRTAKARRRRLVFRGGCLAVGIAAVALTVAAPPVPRLVWNTSASAPVGLYGVVPGADIVRGDMVIARVPARLRALASARRYLPETVPLVKRVAAVAGDEICALGSEIFRDGRKIAVRKAIDAKRRTMPWWEGCRVLRGREVFLLMDAPASFDGRYFGITQGNLVLGRAKLLWAR